MRASKAFTIVELLIVVVVIAILAAVTIVGYNGISSQANKAALETDAGSVAKQLEIAKIRNGVYPSSISTLDKNDKYNYQYTETSDPVYYCVTLEVQDGLNYYFSSDNTTLQEGVCDGHSGGIQQPLLAVGNEHACAVIDEVLKCWGRNNYGQLGAGLTGSQYATPVEVDMVEGLAGKRITHLSAGYNFTCAIADNQPYCWGDSGDGRLGAGAGLSGAVRSPVKVDTSGVLAGKNITQLAIGSFHVCVLADGAPYCWGSGQYGRMGNGSTSSQVSPVAVTTSGLLSGQTITKIVSGLYRTCALVQTGEAYCWGRVAAYSRSTPVAATTSTSIVGKVISDITIGQSDYDCYIVEDTPYCRGSNQHGTVGDGSGVNQNTHVPVYMDGDLSGKTGLRFVGSDSGNHCIMSSDGSLFCWGYNGHGMLGNGLTDNLQVPTLISNSATSPGSIRAFGIGGSRVCVIAGEDSLIYCWGLGTYGRLGNGSTSNSVTPVQVSW